MNSTYVTRSDYSGLPGLNYNNHKLHLRGTEHNNKIILSAKAISSHPHYSCVVLLIVYRQICPDLIMYGFYVRKLLIVLF